MTKPEFGRQLIQLAKALDQADRVSRNKPALTDAEMIRLLIERAFRWERAQGL